MRALLKGHIDAGRHECLNLAERRVGQIGDVEEQVAAVTRAPGLAELVAVLIDKVNQGLGGQLLGLATEDVSHGYVLALGESMS